MSCLLFWRLSRAMAVGFGVFGLAIGSFIANAQKNNLTDLGPYAPGLGINNSGQVVLQNYLYSNGALTAFPANFTGAGINAGGQVAGSVGLNCQNIGLDQGGGCAFATYASGVLTTYPIYDGALDPAVGNQGQGINANGEIVGDWTFTHGLGGAIVLTNGTFSQLRFPGTSCSEGGLTTAAGVAYAINDAGQIVGFLPGRANCQAEAFLYSQGMYDDIGTGEAYALNASGQAVGYLQFGNVNAAFLYNAGSAPTDLRTLPGDTSSSAYAINAQGLVVGASTFSSSSPPYTSVNRAFFYNGAMNDLDTLVSANDPLQPFVTLTDARGINDNGLVVANGVDSRDELKHVYLLQVPLLTTAPGSLKFPSQAAGTASAAQSVILTNVGASAFALGSISTTGNFAQTDDCGASLTPSGSCTVMVTFNPMASGTIIGALTIVAAGTTVAVPLSGSDATPISPPSGGGGGGAVDLLSLICLFGISALRWSRRELRRRGAASDRSLRSH